MEQKFKECDTILNHFKRATRNHILYMLDNYDRTVSFDNKLECYMVKDRYMIYYSTKLKDYNWTCQCKWRSYNTSMCGHVAVIRIYNILTFTKNLVQEYLFYIDRKIFYRRQLRQRTPKFLTKY